VAPVSRRLPRQPPCRHAAGLARAGACAGWDTSPTAAKMLSRLPVSRTAAYRVHEPTALECRAAV